MFQLGKTIVSEDILEKEFVCNLSACKGACCVDGDAGAPLLESETKILEAIYPQSKNLSCVPKALQPSKRKAPGASELTAIWKRLSLTRKIVLT